MAGPSQDNFNFRLIGPESVPFVGYISSQDPTQVSPQAMVQGSQNVILENTENIVNRVGRKRYDSADNTQNPVVSSFDWNDIDGDTLLTRCLEDGKFQFYNIPDETWYTIYTFPITNTDLSYAKWWDLDNSRELLVMCNGTPNLYAWGGGITQSVGDVNNQNSFMLRGTPVLTTFTVTVTGAGNIDEAVLIGSSDETGSRDRAVVLSEYPDSDFEMIVTVNSSTLNIVATILVRSVLIAAPDATTAVVTRGLSKEETAQNILGLLQNPSANTSTQNGFTDSDVITAFTDTNYMTISAEDALESGSSETWAEQGFINYDSIIVNGVEYDYDLVVGRYLVGISGTPPTGQVSYNGIIVTPNRELAGDYPSMLDYNNDFLLVLNNQLIVGSVTSRILHISFDEDYTDFDQTGDLVSGDPDFVILDEFPVGGVVRGQSFYVGAGTSAWYELTPNTPVEYIAAEARTVRTVVNKFSGAGLTAPLGFNFITTWGEDIIYVDQQNQLRTLGLYRNLFQQKSPSLSLAVRRELQAEDFTGGTLKAIGEFVYMVAPISGKTYLYQIRDDIDDVGNITSRRLWQPPQTWNISRLALVNGIPHGYSNETPQLYQLFATNQWHDDTSVEDVFSPYISVARFGYRQIDKGSDRNRLMGFDKIYYEGYILPNSDLISYVYYNYRGATFTDEVILSTEDSNPALYGSGQVTLIGGQVVGAETVGGGRQDVDYSNPLPKFRAIGNVPIKNVFEYQLELVSTQLDSRWELVAIGGNERFVTDNPVNLQLLT